VSKRLSGHPGVLAAAEPTSMTWLPLAAALADAGGQLALVGSRHAARLRGAIVGKNKSDVIDADVLARAGDVFDLKPVRLPAPGQLALRRVCTRRGAAVIDGNRYLRRLISLARWAFPDVWNAFADRCRPRRRRWAGGRICSSWPRRDPRRLPRWSPSIPAGSPTCPPAPSDQGRRRGVGGFWADRLDLDALAFDVTEHLTDLAAAGGRITRATVQATAYWERLYGDDVLLTSLPGVGPVTAPTIRSLLADGSGLADGKSAAAYVGLAPSSWSSGTVRQPSRAISKEGPAVLRLAFYQAANAARRVDPQLAAFYHRLMVERGHGHTQATVAVARKLAERTWTVLHRGTNYQLRDLEGAPITERAAKRLILEQFTVADTVCARARAHTTATHRAKLTR
jgi:transposase